VTLDVVEEEALALDEALVLLARDALAGFVGVTVVSVTRPPP